YHADDRWREGLARLDQVYQPGDLLLFRAGHIDEDYAAETGDREANEFVLNPISGFYNRVTYAPIVSLTKDWDPSRFAARMDEVRRAVEQAWRDDRRVVVAGVDSIIRGRYYFDHLMDFLQQADVPPFERIELQSWGKIKLIVLAPVGRPPAGSRAVVLSPVG